MAIKEKKDDELANEITEYIISIEPIIDNECKKLEAGEAFEKGLDTVIEYDETTIIDEIKIWETITDFLLKEKRISKLHQYIDVFDEVSNSCIWISVYYEKDYSKKKELVSNFINRFLSLKHYESIIFIHGITGLPLGLELGNLEITKSPIDDEKYGSHFKMLKTKSTFKPHTGIDYNNGTFCKIKFDNYLDITTRKKLYSELELPFSILSIYTDYDLDVLNSIGVTCKKDGPICDYFPTGLMIRTEVFDNGNLEYLKIISCILSKSKYNQLEDKILKSLRLYGLSRLSYRIEIRFLILVSACESLLLTGEDRDYSTLKISEKTACLIEDDGRAKYDLYLKMKSIYSKRSKIVHQGDIKIEPEELRFVETIYLKLINKLLIENQKYEEMEKELKDRSLAFNYFFDKIKFNID